MSNSNYKNYQEENEKSAESTAKVFCGKCDKGSIPVFKQRLHFSTARALSSNIWDIKKNMVYIPCPCQDSSVLDRLLQQQSQLPEGALTTLILFDWFYFNKNLPNMKIGLFNPAEYFGLTSNFFNFELSLILPIAKKAYPDYGKPREVYNVDFIENYAKTHGIGAN